MRLRYNYSKTRGFFNLRLGSKVNRKKFLEFGRSKRAFRKRF